MAIKAAVASGTFSTMTWNPATNTPSIHASTAIRVDVTAGYTAGFTAANIGDHCIGVFMMLHSQSATAGTLVVKLQENSAGWVDVASANVRNLINLGTYTWIYISFPTPYDFKATTAGYYRFSVVTAGDNGTISFAADSGGTLISFIAIDDRSAGKPVSGDDIWIGGDDAGAGLTTVTLDGTQTVGSRAVGAVSILWGNKYVNLAVNICDYGKLVWDTAASATLICRGYLRYTGRCSIEIGSSTVCYPAGKTAVLEFSLAADGAGGILSSSHPGIEIMKMYGSPIGVYHSTYTSGAGTAASPLVTADVTNWAAGDVICISGNAYNKQEKKYIRTVVSSSSYTLADSAGGAESGFANTHYTTDIILHGERNVKIRSDNAAYGYSGKIYTEPQFEYVQFNQSGTKDAAILYFSVGYAVASNPSVKYCSFVDWLGPTLDQSKVAGTAFSDCVFFQNTNSNGSSVIFTSVGSGRTFENIYIIGAYSYAIDTRGTNYRFNNIFIYSGPSLSASSGGAIYLANGAGTVFNNVSVQASRSVAFVLHGTAGAVIQNSTFGNIYPNANSIETTADYFDDTLFSNCLLDTGLFYNSGYLGMITGSRIKFHKYNQTENKHFWYETTGIGQSTGAGLDDSTVRTAGSLAVRLSPYEAVNGFIWEFKILAKALSNIYCVGFSKKAAGLVGKTVTIELYLPGSLTADSSFTVTDDTNWDSWIVSANYTGTVDLYAIVRVKILSDVVTDYLYIDDIYNGTNKITALDTWDIGMPSPIMFEQLGDAAAVWAVATAGMTTAGTIGKAIMDMNGTTTSAAIAAAAQAGVASMTVATASATPDGILNAIYKKIKYLIVK